MQKKITRLNKLVHSHTSYYSKFHYSVLIFLLLSINSFGLVSQNNNAAIRPIFRKMELFNGLTAPNYRVQFFDKDGFYWLGTDQGLFRYDGTELLAISIRESEKILDVTAIQQNERGEIFIGTKTGEIFQLNSEYKQLKLLRKISTKPINAIAFDEKNQQWISTAGDGVFLLERSKLIQINKNSGLSDDYCYDLILDQKSRLWVATDQGVSIISKKKNDYHVRIIKKSDGLPDEIVRTLALQKDGSLYVGFQDHGFCIVGYDERVSINSSLHGSWKYGQINHLAISGSGVFISTQKNGIYYWVNEKLHEVKAQELNLFNQVKSILKDFQGNFWAMSNEGLFLFQGEQLQYLQEVGKEKIHHVHCLLATNDGRILFSPDQGL